MTEHKQNSSSHGFVQFLRILGIETRTECLKNLRNPGFMISILVFPIAFYVIFGLAFEFMEELGVKQPAIYAVMCSGFGTIGIGLFGFSIQVANERAQGWILLKRISPMPPIAYFLAKAITAAVFSLLLTVLICLLAILAGGVDFGFWFVILLSSSLAIGSVPFSALGFLLGYSLSPTTVHGIGNLIFLPLVFFSGLAFPLTFMPDYISAVAVVLPSYHFAELILGLAGYRDATTYVLNFATLTFFTFVFLVFGLYLYTKEGRTTAS